MKNKVATLFVLILLTACDRSSLPGNITANPTEPLPAGKYDVTVTRTALGIPHIKAADFSSAGYGYGYVFAEDNLCVMYDDYLTVRGERSKYIGPEGTYSIPANSQTADNLSSDFFWKLMATDEMVERLKVGALPELREVSIGYVDGFNRYIAELKAGQHAGRHAACRDEPYMQPITEADMYRRYFRLAVIASSSVFVSGIGSAQPPSLTNPTGPVLDAVETQAALEQTDALAFFRGDRPFGSNMYAIGPQGSATGMPMVFGNPHFPWTGTERLYISHINIPGRMDIMGSALYGVPGVLIGFNDKLAWSHTVSTAYRFTLYQLELNPLNPTQYLYDGAFRDMEPVPLTVEVKQADGSIAPLQRTLYKTHYGPMAGLKQTLPALGQVNLLPWTNAVGFTLRDANAENDRLINQFYKWDQAQSLTEFKQLQKDILGVPWVNTVAAGPGEKAYYADITVVPHVTDAQRQTCNAEPLASVFGQIVKGVPLLHGSLSACEWGSDPDAPAPGIFGPANLPSLERDDYVSNCNDSYWLVHDSEKIEGYNSIIGPEGTARSLRTRLCLLQAQRRMDGTDGLDGTKFTYEQLKEITLGSQLYSVELARGSVLNTLCPLGFAIGTGGVPVNIAEACTVLEAWDGRANLDSRGAHLWREFWRRASGAPGGLPVNPLASAQWLTPFSADDPVNTPNTLNVVLPTVQAALADAVTAVADSGFALDALFGEVQHSGVNGVDIPIFGGTGGEGAFTIVSGTGNLDADGYGVTYGNSYIQAVTWDDDGVVAEGFITYSQSTDSTSPHFNDFTREYSAKRWHRFPFHAEDVAAQKVTEMRLAE